MSIDNNFQRKFVLFSFGMALFANSHYVNIRGFIGKKHLQMCTVVMDPKTGQVFTI